MQTEYPIVIASKRVKARKEHRCADCYETISPGSTYLRISVKSEGSVYAYKSHSLNGECAEAKWN